MKDLPGVESDVAEIGQLLKDGDLGRFCSQLRGAVAELFFQGIEGFNDLL